MEPTATLAATLVAAAHRHAGRPAVAGTTWGDLARRARWATLGLVAAGMGGGSEVVVAIDAGGDRIVAEMALAAAGAVLVADGHGIDAAALAVAEATGAALDADAPDRFEHDLQALDPGAVLLRAGRREVTSGQALWNLRSSARWLLPVQAGLADDEAPVVVSDGRWAEPGAAALGWWWPCLVGARVLVPTCGFPAALAEGRPHLVVGGPDAWAEVAGEVRTHAAAARPWVGGRHLAAGRALAAGEALGPAERVLVPLIGRTSGRRLRVALGLERCRLAVCLGRPGEASRRDLAAAGVAVLAAWAPPGTAAPVVAGDITERPPRSWGRPLPGYTVKVFDGEVHVERGGGGDPPLATGIRGRLDEHGRLHLARSEVVGRLHPGGPLHLVGPNP